MATGSRTAAPAGSVRHQAGDGVGSSAQECRLGGRTKARQGPHYSGDVTAVGVMIDPRAGAVESHFHLCDAPELNHRIEVVKGILEAECRELMQEFFKTRRQSQRSEVRNENQDLY